MSARAADLLGVGLLALALTLIIAAPVVRAPSERIFGHEIVGRHHDPFSAMQGFVHPGSLGVYLQPLTDGPGALLTRVFGPVAAYNGVVLLTFPLSAATAYLLARYVGLGAPGALIAGIAYAFSPFHLAQAAYHPQVAQTQWLPLYFLTLWRSLDRATPRAVGLLAVTMAGTALSNFYAGLITAAITPIAMGSYWWFKSRHGPNSRQHLVITGACLLAVAGCGAAYAWFAAHPVLADRAAFAFARHDLFRYSAKWWSYVIPPVESPVF